MADELAFMDATANAELVSSGQASPRELVDAAIQRIEKLDGELNAVVTRLVEKARAAAGGELPEGPLRGVPFLLKDLGALSRGDPYAAGVKAARRQGYVADHDSVVTERFRAAGLVCLGRTNLPELGLVPTTESEAYGPCHNPWDLTRSTGGSSGGSAAAVASGMVPVAHASDGGGPIRIPASECGLVGLKPTRGRVSQGPLTGEAWAGSVTDGALARTVRDAAAVLDVISGRMPGEPYYAPPLPRPLREEAGADPGQLRVGLLDRPSGDPDCREAVAAAGRLLESLGHHVAESAPEGMFEPGFARHFNAIIAADTETAFQAFEAVLGNPIAEGDIEPRNAQYRRAGQALTAVAYLQARQWLGTWARHMAHWWTDHDLLVTPTVGAPPPELGWFTAAGPEQEGARIAGFIPYTAQFNMTGQPAVSLPLHWTSGGLPVGVQLVAAYGREDLLVRVASQLERAAPWADRHPAL